MTLSEFLTEAVAKRSTGKYSALDIKNDWDSVIDYFSEMGFEEVQSVKDVIEVNDSVFYDYRYYGNRLFLNINKQIFRLISYKNSSKFSEIYYSPADNYYSDKEISFDEFLKMAKDNL